MYIKETLPVTLNVTINAGVYRKNIYCMSLNVYIGSTPTYCKCKRVYRVKVCIVLYSNRSLQGLRLILDLCCAIAHFCSMIG